MINPLSFLLLFLEHYLTLSLPLWIINMSGFGDCCVVEGDHETAIFNYSGECEICFSLMHVNFDSEIEEE
jgi:hypothetical protein